MPNPNWVNRYDYQIRYYKDTVINSKTYNLYAPFGRTFGFEYCASFIKRGFLRQDTLAKKVFILDSAFVERPLYDFSKGLNDTLQSYNIVLRANMTLTVMNVATATLSNGTYHKALWVSNNNCFIEGVGSVFGGLYGNNQAIFSNNLTEQLMCFGRITPFFELLEGITTQQYICSLVPAKVGINELKNIKLDGIKIYPNPVTERLTIDFGGANFDYLSVNIYTTLGECVILKNISASQNTVDLSLLTKGIYYLNLQSKLHKQYYKIVKE